MSGPGLVVDGLTVRYGPTTAVDGLSLRVDPGRLVGLIGPNGAGKTSAIDALTGFTPAGGRVLLDGHDISGLGAHRRARRGLRRTWQSLELFDDLSVQENIDVSRRGPRRSRRATDAAGAESRALADPLGYLEIDRYRDALPSSLPLGVRKLVGVARALAAEATVIAMDEPAAGLDSAESVALGVKLRQLVDDGLGVLLVDHDMNLVLNVCDYVYVLEFGRLIAEGTPAQVVDDPAVVTAYLGGSSDDSEQPAPDGTTFDTGEETDDDTAA